MEEMKDVKQSKMKQTHKMKKMKNVSSVFLKKKKNNEQQMKNSARDSGGTSAGQRSSRSSTTAGSIACTSTSAMPPWETVKSLVSSLVTDGVSDREEQLEMGIFDIFRAHFMSKTDRELIVHRASRRRRGSRRSDVVARMSRSLCGIRDASNHLIC